MFRSWTVKSDHLYSILSQAKVYCVTFAKLFTFSKFFFFKHPLFVKGIIIWKYIESCNRHWKYRSKTRKKCSSCILGIEFYLKKNKWTNNTKSWDNFVFVGKCCEGNKQIFGEEILGEGSHFKQHSWRTPFWGNAVEAYYENWKGTRERILWIHRPISTNVSMGSWLVEASEGGKKPTWVKHN